MAKNSGPNEAQATIEYVCVQSCTGVRGEYFRKEEKYTLPADYPVPKSAILGPLLVPVRAQLGAKKRKPGGTGAAAINEALGIELEDKGDDQGDE